MNLLTRIQWVERKLEAFNRFMARRVTPPLIALNLFVAMLLASIDQWREVFLLLGWCALIGAVREWTLKGGPW